MSLSWCYKIPICFASVAQQVQLYKWSHHVLWSHDTISVVRLIDAALQLLHNVCQSLIAVRWDQLIQPTCNIYVCHVSSIQSGSCLAMLYWWFADLGPSLMSRLPVCSAPWLTSIFRPSENESRGQTKRLLLRAILYRHKSSIEENELQSKGPNTCALLHSFRPCSRTSLTSPLLAQTQISTTDGSGIGQAQMTSSGKGQKQNCMYHTPFLRAIQQGEYSRLMSVQTLCQSKHGIIHLMTAT